MLTACVLHQPVVLDATCMQGFLPELLCCMLTFTGMHRHHNTVLIAVCSTLICTDAQQILLFIMHAYT
jgi:hypothetical protein